MAGGNLSEIVHVNIDLQTSGVQQAGFGTLLILDAHRRIPDRIKFYSSVDEMADDGFEEWDAAYVAANSYFSQDPPPSLVAIGRRSTVTSIVFVETVTNGFTYEFDVNGVTISYTADSTATEDEIIAGLGAALQVEIAGGTVTNVSRAVALANVGKSMLIVGYTGTEADGDEFYLTLGTDKLGSTVLINSVTVDTNNAGDDQIEINLGKSSELIYKFTATAETKAQIAAALAALVAADADSPAYVNYVTSGKGSSRLYLFGKAGTRSYDVSVSADLSTVNMGITENVTTAIAAILDESDAWYGFMQTSRVQSDQTNAASKIETLKKIHGTTSAETQIISTAPASDTTSLPALLKASSYYRSFTMYHPDADGGESDLYPEAAWFGTRLTVDPDSETATWMYCTLAGIPVTDLTTSQRLYADGDLQAGSNGKCCSIYVEYGGVNITRSGRVAAGEFIDIITGRDWIEQRMMENVFGMLSSVKKVPFDDGGGAMIANQVHKTLKLALATKFATFDTDLGPNGYYIFVPKRADISTANRAARIFKTIKWKITAAGAVHAVTIEGQISI
jgi:hypothetical protein